MSAVHVAKHNNMCADTGRRIESLQEANCVEVCISRHSFPPEIAAATFRSFKERYSWNMKGRAVTVRSIELSPKDSAEQLTLFDNVQHRMAMEKVQDAVEEIRGRFGKSAITYACLMGDLKMSTDGRVKPKC